MGNTEKKCACNPRTKNNRIKPRNVVENWRYDFMPLELRCNDCGTQYIMSWLQCMLLYFLIAIFGYSLVALGDLMKGIWIVRSTIGMLGVAIVPCSLMIVQIAFPWQKASEKSSERWRTRKICIVLISLTALVTDLLILFLR